jgi:hypothetical protein
MFGCDAGAGLRVIPQTLPLLGVMRMRLHVSKKQLPAELPHTFELCMLHLSTVCTERA